MKDKQSSAGPLARHSSLELQSTGETAVRYARAVQEHANLVSLMFWAQRRGDRATYRKAQEQLSKTALECKRCLAVFRATREEPACEQGADRLQA